MEFLLFLVSFAILFIIGMPIAFAMLFSSFLYSLLSHTNFPFMVLEMFKGLDNFVLLAIPMFLLTAEIMNSTTISKRLFKLANSAVGFIPGGLAHVNVVTSIIFSGMSGSAIADVSGIGFIAYKSMVDEGFDKPFSAAVTASSACIGPIIPPSIPMVVYAMVANESIAKLFLGGVFPGLLLGFGCMTYIYIVSLKRGYPFGKWLGFRNLAKDFKDAFLALITPFILLGGITYGVCSVTEAAVLAVIYSCIIGALIYHLLGIRKFFDALEKVFITCSGILIFFVGARMFCHILTVESFPEMFSNLIIGLSNNPIIIIIMINVLFFILGCISDPLINIMLFVPMVLPLAQVINMDLVQFGVIIVFNSMIAIISPPVAGNIFIISLLSKTPFEKIIKEIPPFILIFIIVLILMVLIPELTLFLPDTLLK